MTYLGAIVLAAAMAYALYSLYFGMRKGTYRYFGKTIDRSETPVAFWFVMAVMVACLFLAARIMPIYVVALSQ